MAQSSKEATSNGARVTTVASGTEAVASPPREPCCGVSGLFALKHSVRVDRIAVSNDGGVAFSTGADMKLLRTPLSGEGRFSVDTKTSSTDLALWQDGRKMLVLTSGVLAGTRVGCIKVFDGQDGHVERSMTSPGCVRSLSLGDSQSIFSGGDDGAVRLWDVERGDCVDQQSGPEDAPVKCVKYGGGVLAIGDENGVPRFWDPRSPSSDASKGEGHPGGIGPRCIALEFPRLFTAGRPLVSTMVGGNAVASRRCEVVEWDARMGKVATVGLHADAAVAVESLRDVSGRTLLVSAARDGGAALWDVSAGHVSTAEVGCVGCPLAELRFGQKLAPTALSTARGNVYVVGADRAVRAWDVSRIPTARTRRLCHACDGSGRVDLGPVTCVCMECTATGLFPLDVLSGDARRDDDEDDDGGDASDGGEEAEEAPAPAAAEVPSWLATWLPPGDAPASPVRSLARLRPDMPFSEASKSNRLSVGDTVVLRASVENAGAPDDRLEARQGGGPPSLQGDDVGIVEQDDRSRVPYRIRGPREPAASWYEAWEVVRCPGLRETAGRALLEVAVKKRLAPPPAPPKPQKAHEVDDDEAGMFDFRAAPSGNSRAAAKPAEPQKSVLVSGGECRVTFSRRTVAEKRAERDAQIISDAAVTASLQAVQTRRRPVSDRLKQLRGGE
ncbi:WD40-repeat-containing domain protein [Pelagophyceae sp. CCMP2097]|nr:WD40-repeat-containing domain protein [Pelagophyceae sp. CCMP2097]